MTTVSIITATYNNATTIADTLASVQAQTYNKIEHLIMDGASSDGTVEAIQARSANNTRLHSEPDQGIYDALNKGVAAATGDVIGFVHGDDFLTGPDVIAHLVEALDEGTDGVYGNKTYVDRTNPARVVRYWRSRQWSRNDLRWGWMPPHQALYLRRQVYDRHGAFDPTWRVSADYDFMLRAFSAPGFSAKYVDLDVITMRVGGTSTLPRNLLTKWSEDLRAIRRNQVGGLLTLVGKNAGKLRQLRAR